MSPEKTVDTITSDCIAIFCTVPDATTAERITHALVSNRYAACVNQINHTKSTYLWQESIQTESEILLIIKTLLIHFEKIEACILTFHPYELPEVIAVPITSANSDYIAWLRAMCLHC